MYTILYKGAAKESTREREIIEMQEREGFSYGTFIVLELLSLLCLIPESNSENYIFVEYD